MLLVGNLNTFNRLKCMNLHIVFNIIQRVRVFITIKCGPGKCTGIKHEIMQSGLPALSGHLLICYSRQGTRLEIMPQFNKYYTHIIIFRIPLFPYVLFFKKKTLHFFFFLDLFVSRVISFSLKKFAVKGFFSSLIQCS